MRKVFVLLFIYAMVNPFTLSSQERAGGKVGHISLFNGRNLDGWYTYLQGQGRNHDPKGVFTVQQGMIRISGEEWGCIATVREYDNYRLSVKFRWGEKTWGSRVDKARDSGILLHSQGVDGAVSGTWMYSIECQVIEGGTGDFIVVGDGSDSFSVTCPVEAGKQDGSYVYNAGGNPVTILEGRVNWFGRDPGWKDAKGFRGAKDVEKPAGKWNTLECIVKGSEIKVFLNGTLVNHAIRVQPVSGKIQIQSEGAEIFIRSADLLIY